MTDATSPMPQTLAPPAPPKRGWTKARVAGHVLLGLWIAAGASLVLYLVTAFTPEFADRYAPRILSGILVTIELVVISTVIGALISLPFTFGRMSKNPIIGGISYAYVYFFRGTPLIAQVFLIYYGAGEFRGFFESLRLWWFFSDPFYCAIFAFSLNTSAYQAEILRGAIQNMPQGQWEAGDALGLPRHVTFLRVILPQALIVALRPYGNEIVLMIKGSAIASIITVFDLMGETRRAFSRSFDFQIYLWAAVTYLIMVETLRRVWDRLEVRLTRHLKRVG
ncbi:MAG: ABC transporter permease [Pseudomonadota bacterium]